MTISEMKEFKSQLSDYNARHGASIFLILYALIGLDTMSIQDEAQRQKVTATWVAWGITFILLGFFVITPEQNEMAIRQATAT